MPGLLVSPSGRGAILRGRQLVGRNAVVSPLGSLRTQVTGLSTALSGELVVETYPADVPRFNALARRLLVEGQRTNLVTNPRGEGAIAGSPGTAPTGWFVAWPAGWTATLNGINTSHGIPLLDYSVTVAAGTSAVAQIRPADPAGAPGTAYSGAWYARLVSGTAPPARLLWQDGGTTSAGTQFQPQAALTRHARTVTSSGTATLARMMFELVPDGVSAYSFRLLVGCPQVEVGAFASTLILPAAGSPAATTRGADVVTGALSALGVPGSSASTWWGAAVMPPPGAGRLVQIDGGSETDRMLLFAGAIPGEVNLQRRINNGAGSIVVVATVAVGQPFGWAMTLDGAGGVRACIAGGEVVSRTGGPTNVLTTLRIGNNPAANSAWGDEIGPLSLLPFAVPDTTLQSLAASVPLN